MEYQPNAQGRNSGGVMIILGTDITRAWARRGKLKPIQSKPNSKYPGQLIGVTKIFLNRSNRKLENFLKWAKGNIKLFLCSAYQPYKHAERTEFYDEFDNFLTNRPRILELLLGVDVNCNFGIRLTMVWDVVGSYGLRIRKFEGKKPLIFINV